MRETLSALTDFLTSIRLVGDEILDNLFFMGDSFLGELLLGLLAIVLKILWGLLVYLSPIIILVIIFKTISKSISNASLKKLTKGLVKKVLAACEQEGIHNISEFSAFFTRNNCIFELTPTDLALKTGLKIICVIPYSDLGYRFSVGTDGPQRDVKKKLRKLAKNIAEKLSISCSIKITSNVDSGMKGIGPSHIESKISDDGKTVESREVYKQYLGWYYETNIVCTLTPLNKAQKETPQKEKLKTI